ncbi:MAG: GNAT family N-acetyltransferase [Candidatus Riflebacteria bacterium]|nr:GNAT family N-acetyltransferase [Candidatus Riflebacteria bacterium]
MIPPRPRKKTESAYPASSNVRPGKGFIELMPPGRMFHSRRLVLRRLNQRDVSELMLALKKNQLWLAAYLPAWPGELTKADLSRVIRREHVEARSASRLDLGVFSEKESSLIGRASLLQVRLGVQLSAGIGYWIDEAMAGQGLGKEAVATLVSFAFEEAGLHRIWASVCLDNSRSMKLLETLGFKSEGIHRKELFIAGRWQDMCQYSILREEYDLVADTWIKNGWLGWAP